MDKHNWDKWQVVDSLHGEYSINNISYNANDLDIVLDGINDTTQGELSLHFSNVFAYRVTLEHFRWADEGGTSQTHRPLYRILHSSYLRWLKTSGMEQLYGDSIRVKHYLLYTTEHIIDILIPKSETVLVNGGILKDTIEEPVGGIK